MNIVNWIEERRALYARCYHIEPDPIASAILLHKMELLDEILTKIAEADRPRIYGREEILRERR